MKIVFIILMVLIGAVCHAQNWTALSKDIKKKQISELHLRDASPVNAYDYCRRHFDMFNLLDIDVCSDTVYIIENLFDIIIGDVGGGCGTVFTNSDLLSYDFPIDYKKLHYKNGYEKVKFKKDKAIASAILPLHIEKKPFYHLNMMKLVAKWDIEGLKRESENYGTMIPAMDVIIARVIFKERKYKIDCFRFEYYFNIDRDDISYYYYDHTDLQTILKKIFE